jgi:predicted enzyme related to lactoylglutathione lyase
MPVERDQEAELNRLLGLGATIVDDRRTLRPGGWVVLADPEGNEFCLE